ncbi:MAG: helix-turn-helix domain-containing protein, partial [Alphaproteobacteria bacterium]
RVRVGEACRLLVETEEQVSNVCFAVGYQNLANFNRQFMKLKGMTPTQFREHTRSGLSKLPVPPSTPTSLESLNP